MIPRRRILEALLVLLLLAVPFFFLRVSIRDPRETSVLNRVALQIATPLQWGAGFLARATSNLWGDYVYLVDVKADNERLAYENARLGDRVRRLEREEAENRRLRRLLGLREQIAGDMVSAQVVAKDINTFFRVATVTVDRGGRDIRPKMPVIAQDGVVGQVLRVAGERVDVQLAVDAGSGIDVVDEVTGARGFVEGVGDQTRYACRVDYVQRTDEVNVGDLLVTSGVGRAFPKGVPVARVTRVDKRDFGMFQAVEATPTVDFTRLEEVLILLSPPVDEPPPKGSR